MSGMTKFKQAFCSRLMLEREKRNLTQGQISDLLGISRMTYISWEKGTKLPTFERAYSVWKVLGISFEQLEHLMNLYDQMEKS